MIPWDYTAAAAIAAAVIVKDRRVLMVRRRIQEGQLSWQFPAGKIEPGESIEAAAIRETWEEVGITVEAVQRLGERVHPATGRIMMYVACRLVDGVAYVAAEREIAEVQWCDALTLVAHVAGRLHDPVQAYLDGRLA
jgi:8-oxo-dGTP diphosphatase